MIEWNVPEAHEVQGSYAFRVVEQNENGLRLSGRPLQWTKPSSLRERSASILKQVRSNNVIAIHFHQLHSSDVRHRSPSRVDIDLDVRIAANQVLVGDMLSVMLSTFKCIPIEG